MRHFLCHFAQFISFDGKKVDFTRSKYEICGYVAIIIVRFFPGEGTIFIGNAVS